MSTTAGVFSETTLQAVRSLISQIRLDDRVSKQFQARVDSINVMPKIQTANLTLLSNKEKDYEVEAELMNSCGIDDQACTSCTVGGTELSTNTEKYKLDLCREVPFTVNRKNFIDNDFGYEEAIAKGLLQADVKLSEYICQQLIAVILGNAGTNQFNLAGEIGTVVGNTTQIATANFNVNAIPYLLKVMNYNRFTNPTLLSGNLLFDAWQTAQFNAGNDNGKGNQAMFNSLDMNWDIYNFTALGLNAMMFAMSQGSLAWANKTYHGPAVEDFGKEGKRWSIPSQFIPGFNFDVHYNTGCDTDFIKEDFKVKTKFGIFVNPEGCEAGNNGILSFTRV